MGDIIYMPEFLRWCREMSYAFGYVAQGYWEIRQRATDVRTR